MIVFCDGCNRAWHQLCHDPHIANEVIWLKEKEWFCKECKPAPQPNPLPAVVNTVPQQLVKLRIPSNGSLQATPRVDVDATNFTMAERRGYLSSLSHASLVELLVNISEEHPSLTIFPSNLKELQLSKFVFQQSITKPTAITTLAASTPTNTSVSASSTNNVPSNNTGSNQPSSEQLPEIFSASQPKRKRQRYDSDEDSEYEEYQDHRLYPRAGNGFRLSLNVGDLDMLAEDPVCPTFSHSLHGPAQARAVARQVAPVWTAG
ncbi:hypothetical protein ASPZODRAFT_15027 [Penicilliopsis zonata CBS 506.65]|uniref:Zinc finger PHD-type domain-containing protein n=1 Tax=Penicilliopsis zonata CBS 506.65 TaxID=1073090 RepID=A0A1L9SKF7_9EURO|nr:hypothetical protein ASPZODRAFT_15027 [Penicilliopsis zonata CBS 506.65]OJJ47576.1 hypothetical protein ASPZODRAFT_15027 [Penicilliopsis zonata CBS 506.65]